MPLIKKLIAVIFASIVIYLGIVFVLTQIEFKGIPIIYYSNDYMTWKGGKTYQTFKDFDTNNQYDIIVLGSSHAYRGYDPRIFEKEGLDIFNLGTSGQSLMNSYFLLKTYVRKSNTKLVILDIYEGSFTSDAVESTSDLIANTSSIKAAFCMGVALGDIRTINMLFTRIFIKNRPAMYNSAEYRTKGYAVQLDTLKRRPKLRPNRFFANRTQLKYFTKIIEYVQENDISLVLTSHPLPYLEEDNYHREFNEIIMPIAKMANLKYIDYSFHNEFKELVNFADHNHLNPTGVEKFNESLIQEFKKSSFLDKILFDNI